MHHPLHTGVFSRRGLIAFAMLCGTTQFEAQTAAKHPLQPVDRVAIRDAFQAYDQGDTQRAEPALLALIRKYPKNYEVNEALGSLYAEASDPRRALPYLECASRLAPRQALARANLGAVYLKLTRPADAVEELELAAKLDPGNAQTQSNLGRALMLVKQPKAAAQAFRAASNATPEDVDLKYNLALALYESGAFDRAGDILDALPVPAMTAETHALAGDADEHAARFAKALTHYEAAAQSAPTDANLYALTAELLRHWNWDEAIKVADYGSSRYPSSQHFRTASGFASYARNDYASAVTIFSSLLQTDPDNALAADLLGRSCGALPDGENAGCAVVLDFAKRHPGNAVMTTYAATAMLHAPEHEQNLEEASSLLHRAIASDPSFAEAYLRMGVLEQMRQHWSESANYLERAVALDPTAPEAHYRLSRAYAHLGRSEDAKTQIALHKNYAQQAKDSLDTRMQEVMRFILNPS